MAIATELDIESVVREHQQRVWLYLRALGADAQLADDCTQEAFIAYLRAQERGKGVSAIGPYLRVAARNVYISHLRAPAMQRFEETEAEAAYSKLVEYKGQEALLDALEHCLGALDQRSREALELRYRHDLSREEVARRFEVGEEGASKLLYRAKRQLKRCIEERIEA